VYEDVVSGEDLRKIFGFATIAKKDAFEENKLFYITGNVIEATNNRLLIRKPDGGLFSMHINDVVEIRIIKSKFKGKFKEKREERR